MTTNTRYITYCWLPMNAEIEALISDPQSFYPFSIHMRDGRCLRILERDWIRRAAETGYFSIRKDMRRTLGLDVVNVAEVAMVQPIHDFEATRLLLVEPRPIFAVGIRSVLSATLNIDVVGCTGDGESAVALCADLNPEVVLMNVAVPKLNASEVTRRILKLRRRCKVILLAAKSDADGVDSAIEAGAVGCIMETSSPDDLVEGIQKACKGDLVVPGQVLDRLFKAHCSNIVHHNLPRAAVSVSGRDLDVLRLVANGKVNRQIASELGIGIKSVEKYRKRLMKKLGIHDVAGLTRYALANGYVPIDV